MSAHVVGIDGGGTATRAAVLDLDGLLRGEGRSGPSNYDDVGEQGAEESIAEAVAEARREAGLKDEPFAAAFLGLAGIVSAEDRAVVRRIAGRLDLAPPERTGVDHDARVALAGGLSGRPGLVLIAGTGSSCYGRSAGGDAWMAGGWGALLADEGSGYWLGVEAMKAAVKAHDGRGTSTALEEHVGTQLNLSEMSDIMHRVYVKGLSRAETAALAPVVFEAARAGDGPAQSIIQRGACALSTSVRAVAERLGFQGGDFELVLAGGLWQSGDVYRQPFEAAVHERLPRCRFTPAELPPTLGAGLLAIQQAGKAIDEEAQRRLRRAANAWPDVPAQDDASPAQDATKQPA